MRYSHSIVLGGFELMSYTTLLIPRISEMILDEMARLVSLFIVIALDFAVALWRDHRRLSCREQWFDHTLVGVEGFVRQQSIGRHLRQQCIGALQIMGLTWR